MGQRVDACETVRREARGWCAFLVPAGGFAGPEDTANGIAYYRPGLEIEIRYVGGREPEVATTVRCLADDGRSYRSALLDCLYVAWVRLFWSERHAASPRLSW